MQTVKANEVQVRLGAVMKQVQREPITIQHGKSSVVMLSTAHYARLQEKQEAIKDGYWLALSQQAEEEGFCGVEESEAFMRALEIKHAQS